MSQPVLTNHLKTQLINNALEKAGIPKRKSALRAARVEWAERVRLAAIGGVEKEAEILKNIKKIESMVTKIPDSLKTNSSLIRKDCCIYLNLAGARANIYFNGNYRGYESGAPEHINKIAPAEFTLLGEDPLVTEFYSFDALYTQIKSDETEIIQNVSAALNKVRTVKRLLDVWPEAKELLPTDAPPVPLAPAVHRETLNEMIGLPTNTVSDTQ
ncbi:Nmad5 family putative nucleotide modification protein [Escherichia coli]|nr:hypothetical protein [Escherichia coli]EEZ9531684.1 hypothetical protein [Escherichia coli]EFE0869230.1 hypothetical protein [Escherichia coli]EFJ3686404.1 hypothetical protein [Escherichia coli]EFJ3933450.1 hypothetical protein [Escherichia coli]